MNFNDVSRQQNCLLVVSNFKNTYMLLKIYKNKTTPWHPQTNGFLERPHKPLNAYFRNFVIKDNNWDALLCYVTFCYNMTVHTSTN